MRVLLLPGMDGTGLLFAKFMAEAPTGWACEVVSYPVDQRLGYAELGPRIHGRLRASDEPTLVIAESFSGPLAISLAAAPPPNLRAVVLVASFARSPVPRWLAPLLGPRCFRRPPTPTMIRMCLTGWDAQRELVDAVRAAIVEVAPRVLERRARAVLEVDVRDRLARVSVPMLILRASADRLVSARALRPLPPGVREQVLTGPHLLLQRRPRACVVAIERFVDESDHNRPQRGCRGSAPCSCS